MKILIDMNLSPKWVEVFMAAGLDAVHWFAVGDPRATDRVILEWAKNKGYTVFTHDLDFGAILAATRASGPSVIQVRTENILPTRAAPLVIAAIRNFEEELESGALISIDPESARARVLPLRR